MEHQINGQKISRRRPAGKSSRDKGFVSIIEGSSFSSRRSFIPGMFGQKDGEPSGGSARRATGPEIIRPRPSRTRSSARFDHANAPFINFEALRASGHKTWRSIRIRTGNAASDVKETLAGSAAALGGRALMLFRSAAALKISGGIPASQTEAARFQGSILEPAWLLFIDGVPGRAVALSQKVVLAIRRSPLRIAALTTAAALFAAIAVIGISFALQPRFPLPEGDFLPEETTAQELLLSYVSPELGQPADEAPLAPLPAFAASMELRSYIVRGGDSLAAIAKRFRLRQDTVISVNNLRNSASFKTGMELKIPNMDGITHRIRSGDTLPGISKKYGIEITRLADTNNLASSFLKTGTDLFIPGARLAPSALQGFYAVRMIWPTRGPISSSFGYRSNPFTGVKTFHAGIDIVVNTGTPVKSIMDGSVSDSGYNGVFGNYIIITHSEGYQTLYGHLSSIGVHKGQSVSQGTVVGKSGNTGYSTGPHLHLGLFKKGTAINPIKLLK